MREGWEYKRFEDCIIKAPKLKQVQTSLYNSGTMYPIVSQEEKLISGFCDDEAMVYHLDSPIVVFGDHTRVLKYIDFDFVVGADGVKILIPKENVDAKFFYYYLLWCKIPSLGYSRHYKLLKEIKVLVPPKSHQLIIVTELDQINDLIRLKKEQLKEYDNLAQSIFYDMFGDPVENEKGWEMKKLGDVSTVVTGNTPPRKVLEYYNSDYIEWIKSDNISDVIPYPTKAKEYLSESGAKKGRIANAGDILVTCIAGSLSSVGTSCLLDRSVTFNQQINAMTKLVGIESFYLRSLMVYGKEYVQGYATTGMKHIINKSVFESIKIPLPPLPLQQEFSTRIELIEKLKAEVQKNITDLETLLASRMQYWFE